jgi:hypothetical protein
MRVARIWPVLIPLLLSLPMATSPAGQSQAATAHAFIVSATDGYGVQDCLGNGDECGRIVADAWCEAHGHGAAITYGRAEDVTGAISLASASDKTRAPYVITCSE